MNKFFQLTSIGIFFLGGSIGFFIGKNSVITDEHVVASYPGGKIKDAEANTPIMNQLASYEKAIRELKRKSIVDAARQHELEKEAAKKNKTADEVLGDIKKEHDNDEVTEEEIKAYVKRLALDYNTLSKKQIDTYRLTVKNQKIMTLQMKHVESLVDEKDIKFKK